MKDVKNYLFAAPDGFGECVEVCKTEDGRAWYWCEYDCNGYRCADGLEETEADALDMVPDEWKLIEVNGEAVNE